ncbi:MAG: glycosyltransferase family 4 protein [Flavobacteriales bacterium]|jgi:glycosyltransferase involved in cell wall biosynthesis
MKIAVNTRLLLKNKLEGIGWFSYETLSRITKNHPNDEFIFIFDRPWHNDFIFSDNITPVQIGPPSRHPFLWYAWFQISIPKILNQHKPDVFLSPDGYLSTNTNVPSLPVIHDINFEHYPKDLPFWYSKYYRHYFPKFAKKSTRIATVSQFSKNDIAKKYKVDPNKIDVVYNGVSDRFKPLDKKEINETQKDLANGNPYFVFVGAIHPRKNIAKILEAFEDFKSTGNYNHKLLLVGKKKWWTSEMEETFQTMKYKGDVIFKDNMNAQQVAQAIGAADALLYVSTFEGFGIPILEAMNCGVPVITSDVSSMPEVAGNAALLCSPFKSDSISEQMKRLVHEPNLSNSLIEKGLLRAKGFSWDKTSELLWKSLEGCVS